jgi:hypothetical protein
MVSERTVPMIQTMNIVATIIDRLLLESVVGRLAGS